MTRYIVGNGVTDRSSESSGIKPGSDKHVVVFLLLVFILTVFRLKINSFKSNKIKLGE